MQPVALMTSTSNRTRHAETSSITALPSRIPSLDGLRAISIVLVLIGHASPAFQIHTRAQIALWTVIGNPGLGVRIFFVISGFLITTLLIKEEVKTGMISLKDFYLRRVVRIFPAFYTYLAVIAVLWASGVIKMSWITFTTAALFFRNYAGAIPHRELWGDTFVTHIWSLSVEEQFYWLWPLSLVLVRGKKRIGLAIVAMVLERIAQFWSYYAFPHLRGQLNWIFDGTESLMIGCIIAVLYKDEAFQALMQKLYRAQVPALAAIFVFVVSPFLELHFKSKYEHTVGFLLDSMCAGLIMLYVIQNSRTQLGKFLNSPIVVHIGVISYSLYLWQQLFLMKENTTFTGRFPLNIMIAIVLAELSYHLIESPLLALRKRLAHVDVRLPDNNGFVPPAQATEPATDAVS